MRIVAYSKAKFKAKHLASADYDNITGKCEVFVLFIQFTATINIEPKDIKNDSVINTIVSITESNLVAGAGFEPTTFGL